MKKILLIVAAATLFAAVSCDKNGNDVADGSLVGEWSITDVPGEPGSVMIHISFKADGNFEMVMPAWIERRTGTYTDKGDSFTFKINHLEWVFDRGSGYKNVYDQYGCWFAKDDWQVPEEERELFPNPQAEWEKQWREDASGTIKYSFDNEGRLILEGGMLGIEMPYVKDPDFNAEEACRCHMH